MKVTTLFIGYERKVGTFIDKTTGENVAYSNRILRFITNSGANATKVGYAEFSEKMKRGELSGILGCGDNEEAVDTALNNLLQKEVITSFAPVGGNMCLVYFAPVPKSGS